MIGIFYLLLTLIFGFSFVYRFIDYKFIYESLGSKKIASELSPFLFLIPIGWLMGIILMTTANYYIIYILNILFKPKSHYTIGIIITILLFTIMTIYNFKFFKKININNKKKNCLFYIIVTLAIVIISSFLMFYTYNIKNNTLYVGFSTFSDMSPHTAMVSSFGIGENIPTNYMHFGNDGIRYHFLFYFFAGLLKYMGLLIDYAINIPSIITMTIAIVLAGLLSTLISKNKIAFLITPILILFRSSFNIVIVIWQALQKNINVFSYIFNNNNWYDITPFDKWGIWSINVYPNQRHIMLGMAVILTFIIILLPYVKDTFKNLGRKNIFKTGVFSKDAWIVSKNDSFAIPLIFTTICLPYFHGSALITCLLVLFGMAILSKKKLIYLIIAVLAISFSMIQTNLLSGGSNNVVNFIFNPGFVLESHTLIDIIKYLFMITGLSFILVLLYSIKNKKDRKYLLYICFCFFLPIVFAFCFQLTIEMLANHKFIQFSIILFDVLIAAYISELINKNKRIYSSGLILILFLFLIGTGFSEWITFININKNKMQIKYNSEDTTWIKENTNPDNVFLTPMWSLNSFFLSGRSTYYGWAYYAWSAGHDTDTRLDDYRNLLSGMNNNIELFIDYCKRNNIKYFIDSPDYYQYEESDNIIYNRDYIINNLELCASFDEYSIYKIY